MPTFRSLYNSKEWILCTCSNCGQDNYVEPHGTTADCKRCRCRTEHESIPWSARDAGAGIVVNIATLRSLVPLRTIA
jgi:hypothetical protein